MEDKATLRTQLKARRRDHVAALPRSTRALLFMRPPGPVAALAAGADAIGLYHATADEAPTLAYARWFHEHGKPIALPWFAARGAPMEFRRWDDPYDGDALVPGPYGALQPHPDAAVLTPDFVFVPLVGFTAGGARLGQGGGHYDRWLAANPGAVPVGLAWDCQLVDSLPIEPHDRPLRAVVTPTRFLEGGE